MAQLELEQLHQDMLDAISNRYQKTAGFPAYDFTRAFALAIMSLASDIEAAEAHLNVDNLSGAELDEFIRQRRAMERKYAAFAQTLLRVQAGEGDIHAGDLFSTASGVEFQAITDGHYRVGETFTVRAVIAGASGNVPVNSITYMPVTIPGIGAVSNTSGPGKGGADAETDEAFRERYYQSLRNPANGANAQSYIEWATSVPGVGRAVVMRSPHYNNTVDLYIINSDMEAASGVLVQRVKEVIDPVSGDGSGLAPLGINVMVGAAWNESVGISLHVDAKEGYTINEVKLAVQQRLDEHLKSIALKEFTIRYNKIAEIVSDTPGVLDYSNLRINNGTNNVTLQDEHSFAIWNPFTWN